MPSVAVIGTRGYPSYYGGFETAVRNLAPHLADQGWDVTVYGRHESTKSSDPTRDPRIRSIDTWGMNTKSLSTLSYGFSSTLHTLRARPDVALVMNCANGYWLPLLRLAKIPTVVNVDGIEWERAKWGRIAKRVFRTGAKLTAKYGTTLVFDAREIASRWGSEFRREGEYIPYGGEFTDLDLPLEPGLTHRGYVLMVARFVPENTVSEFLEAAAQIADVADVVIVGSSGFGGMLDARAKDLASSNPRVHWLGHINDDSRLHSLWQHAGVYFHGHSVGGTNPALVQAMALGAPTLARDTPFNREVLGDGGVFVQPKPTEIAAAAKTLIADGPRLDQMSKRAATRALEHYTWQHVNERYADALSDCGHLESTRLQSSRSHRP
ncbi:glycosyltransferase [Demequina sp. SYSU T00192]|uniref:Glycosyltransferase n=1 Tax=Demequina litoralis TaxID=3051660 RepID=A0ABT8G9Q8_9MICO|nr:glycosyltransferase [Demequina sp. SYSU T00192]MDN4475429.1 glycosyltransferase [Demequina sp. SYSU T00192]